MTQVATTRNYLSDLLKAGGCEDLTYNTARVLVKKASGTKAVNPIGLALIWDNSISAFREMLVTDTIPSTASSLPNASPAALSVGDGTGAGNALSDVTLSSAGVYMDVLFRGSDDIAVVYDGINFESTATNTEKGLFRVQLEKQGILVSAKSTAVTHTYV